MAQIKTKSKKSLVIVESPAKAKTINKYLGPNYIVKASMGHVRDLPSKSIAVDISNSFEPTYEIIPTRKKTLADLKKAAQSADMIYLATDLDREGEAIAWHLVEALGVDPEHSRRVVFNAITKASIQQAFENAHSLDMDKVYAQQARRILDRIVGYEISPLLWKKVARGLSAGRVQSVAVKLIVIREREIQAFKPEEYWKITGFFQTENQPQRGKQWSDFLNQNPDQPPTEKQKTEWLGQHDSFEASLTQFADKPFRPENEKDAQAVFQSLHGKAFRIGEITTKQTSSSASPPFITSTLQQQAVNRLGFSTKRTMMVAQQLYEGVEISGQGSLGLITYMRTDSTHLAPEAVQSVRQYIQKEFGDAYLPDAPKFFSSSNKSAQEAHEAIRPTDVELSPEQVRKDLSDEQFKLYQLIWNRYVACQMTPARWDVTSVKVLVDTSMGQAVFKANGRKLLFDGFMRVAGMALTNGDQLLPALKQNQPVWPLQIDPTQHFTSPPPRYTEASLVKTLEAEGIGRPSTYASIISTIQDRGYVEQLDKKFHATDLGIVVTDKLSEHFTQLMDLQFTSHMEEQLDKIEDQHLDWVQVLREFYGPFKETLDRAHEEMAHAKSETQPSEYVCPKCKKPLVYRFGKNGRFLSCSAYPECEFAAPCDREGKIAEPEKTDHKCPNCGKEMILRKGRFGSFLGCSAYPECKTTQKIDKQGNILPPKAPPVPTGVRCHKCQEGELVIRQSKRGPFMGCGRFPKCRTIVSMKLLDQLKELQQQGVWPPKTAAEADAILGRDKKSDSKSKAKSEDAESDEALAKPAKKSAKKSAPKSAKEKS